MKRWIGILVIFLVAHQILGQPVVFPWADRSEGESEQIESRKEWFFQKRDLGNTNRPDLRRRAAVEKMKWAEKSSLLPDGSWTSVGPSPMTMLGWLMGPVAGRVSALAVDPTNVDTLYLGAASGGLWKSEDGGNSWTSIFDQSGTQSIGAICLEPGNPETIWVGTGEQGQWCGSYFGIGLFKSVNGGLSFFPVNGTGNSLLNLSYISTIAVHPENPDIVLVGGHAWCDDGEYTMGGLYRTTDGGSHWTQIKALPVNDILIDPTNGDTMYASISRWGLPGEGLYKSIDAGETWQKLSSGLPQDDSAGRSAMGRSRLAMAPSDPRTLYALINLSDGVTNLYRSTNAGASWARMNDDACEGQCSYNLCLAVHPDQPSTLILGSLRFAVSYDAGSTLTYLTDRWGGAQTVHQDTHVLVYDQNNPDRFWIGSDGGLWRTDDHGQTFSNLNGNLNITQFYDIAVHPDNPNIIYGGSQDNSSSRTDGQLVWNVTVVTGDGFTNVIDPGDTQVVFQTSYPIDGLPILFRSRNGGGFFRWLTHEGLTEGESWPWVTPMDAAAPSESRASSLYIASNRVYRSWDQGDHWQAISPSLPLESHRSVSALEIKSTGDAVMGYVGTTDGKIYRCLDATATTVTWEDLNSPFPDQWVSDLDFVPAQSHALFATKSAFGGPKLYRWHTADGQWQAVGLGLPDVPASSVIVHPYRPTLVFVGTDIGVYCSVDGGDHFSPFTTGFPLGTVVEDLEFNPRQNVLTAGTYGRGAWQFALPMIRQIPLPAVYQKSGESIREASSPSYRAALVNPHEFDLQVTVSVTTGQESTPDRDTVIDLPSQGHKIVDLGVLASKNAGSQPHMLKFWGNPLPKVTLIASSQDGERLSGVWADQGINDTRLLLPHIAKDREQFFTGLSVYADTSTPVNWLAGDASTEIAILDGENTWRAELGQIFATPPSAGHATVTSSTPNIGLSGVQSFGTWETAQGSHRWAILPLTNLSHGELVFPHVASDLGLFWTGLVAVNGTTRSAHVTVQSWDASGNLLQEQAINLAPDTKLTLLFDDNPNTSEAIPPLDNTLPEQTAWVRLKSTQPLSGFELFGSSASSQADYMEGVLAQGLPITDGVLPYVHVGENRWTGLVLVNPNEVYSELFLTVRNALGEYVAGYVLGLGPGAKFTSAIESMFSPEEISSAASLWIKDETGEGVMGLALFGDVSAPRKVLGGCALVPLP